MKNLHPAIQSAGVAVATVIALGSLWHKAVIAPIETQIVEVKKRGFTIESSVGEIKKDVQAIEINQAKLSVSLENLARSIERLANQLERQLVVSNDIRPDVFPPVAKTESDDGK